MTETIQASLITLLSGFLGAAVGAFTTCWTIRKNALNERRNRLFAEKRSAYAAFLDAFFSLSTQISASKDPNAPDAGEGPEPISRLSAAYAKARLFAPSKVAAFMETCVDSVYTQGQTRCVPDKAGEQFKALIAAMQTDLNETIAVDFSRDGATTR